MMRSVLRESLRNLSRPRTTLSVLDARFPISVVRHTVRYASRISLTPSQEALSIRYTNASHPPPGSQQAREDVPRFRNFSKGPAEATGSNGDILAEPIYLRDQCKCSKCVDPSTRQREFSYADIPINIKIKSQSQDEQGNLNVTWENDIPGFEDHVSHYKHDELVNLFVGPPPLRHRLVSSIWNREVFESETEDITFDDFMNDRRSLANVIRLLDHHGLVFIKGVPEDAESVGHIAERIGPLRNTFYGSTWDVRSVPQAKNVAYTSKYLGFHMDLLYMREPPHFQLLHCLQNTCTGGESRFADTFKAVDVLLTENKEYVDILATTQLRYEYCNDAHYYSDSKMTLDTNEIRPPNKVYGASSPMNREYISQLSHVYWSPPFVGALSSHVDTNYKKFIQASKAFSETLEKDELVVQTKMEAGTCAIFDNLRVVHARNSFDMNSGKRWLRGAYLNYQDFYSRLDDVIGDIRAITKDQLTQQESKIKESV